MHRMSENLLSSKVNTVVALHGLMYNRYVVNYPNMLPAVKLKIIRPWIINASHPQIYTDFSEKH